MTLAFASGHQAGFEFLFLQRLIQDEIIQIGLVILRLLGGIGRRIRELRCETGERLARHGPRLF
jgi:hypothetical protein